MIEEVVPSPSANYEEIQKYSQYSADWWTKTGSLYTMNKVRVPLVKEGLERSGALKHEFIGTSTPLKGLKILDVGCGGGFLSEALAKLGCTIVGLDLCPEQIIVAREHAALDPSLTNLSYCVESIEYHSVKNFEKYDAVVASEVVEHVNDVDSFLQFSLKCLKPGGSLFVTTFNKTWSAWLIGILVYENISGNIPKNTHTWDMFISPQDITEIVGKYNCKTVFTQGYMYNLFNGVWYWSSCDWIHYGLHAVKH